MSDEQLNTLHTDEYAKYSPYWWVVVAKLRLAKVWLAAQFWWAMYNTEEQLTKAIMPKKMIYEMNIIWECKYK